MAYPEYVDGKPPVVTLKEYDGASWAPTTCLDFRNNEYVVVIMETPETIIATIDKLDAPVLDKIFKSAHETHEKQKQDGSYNE
ncbi:hypothetical protein Cantr_05331 [Candida viswanathii]|uniref:Uncharacterized protein n=1 Tax=Candida viswanathii TaxID=5486 RepID=A0A367XSY2_9ASCO|nr:hypothetical protein Cantr_05331 [Candida viswanathii]